MITRSMFRRSTIMKCRHVNWKKMVSGSKVRNYLLNDPMLDYLIENKVKRSKPKKKSKFLNTLFENGNQFEGRVFNYLSNIKEYKTVQVAESYQARGFDKYKFTVECMRNGIDIIYQGVLHDLDNNIYGCPDFMIRSDKINDILNFKCLEEHEKNIVSPKLGLDFHYVIIDVKNSTVEYTVDNLHIRNSKCMPSNKGQIYLYTKCLEHIQGYEPTCGFVVGNRTLHRGVVNDMFMEAIGRISYDSRDFKYKQLTFDAIDWIQQVRENGKNWNLLPTPSDPKLYPNMKNKSDQPYRDFKVNIANELSEITNVYMCGITKRNEAHSKGILSWKDERCNSENLGFKKNHTSELVDAILNINRQDKELFKTNGKTVDTNKFKFYLDYETIGEFVFMIGIGWEENSKWEYKCFLANGYTLEHEHKMFREFVDFVNTKSREPIFFHWSKFEVIHYNKLVNRHDIKFNNYEFFDLYQFFIDNKIVTKGALDFSIKSVAKALHQNNLIHSCWDRKSKCSDGMEAHTLAINMYENNKFEKKLIKDITNYNEVDCKVMYEILFLINMKKEIDLN